MKDTYTPVSVPAYSRPGLTGSSRITRVKSSSGMPSVIWVQVAPESVVLYKNGRLSSNLYLVADIYAVDGSWAAGSMMAMRVQSGIYGGVISV